MGFALPLAVSPMQDHYNTPYRSSRIIVITRPERCHYSHTNEHIPAVDMYVMAVVLVVAAAGRARDEG